MVKIIVINGSARMDKGNTALVLESFLDGMKQAGASVELFYARGLNVKPCTGELYCWHERPGRCYIEDDMQKLYPKLRQADILVLATPVYLPLPGEIQNVVNRLCPLIEPILKSKNGRTRAKFHNEVNIRKIVLVSVCGWWETGNFDTLVRVIQEIAKDVNCEFAGAVLRPHAYLMRRETEKTREVTNALKEVGFELVKHGTMPQDLLETIRQPLISEEEYRQDLTSEYLENKKNNSSGLN
ncbi:MAG: flavodoxin family protein [Candidatus Bathyarchaeota archaeon]|nr:flavodoxin family protein [Candidatus Bathyarchaeota archaeon]